MAGQFRLVSSKNLHVGHAYAGINRSNCVSVSSVQVQAGLRKNHTSDRYLKHLLDGFNRLDADPQYDEFFLSTLNHVTSFFTPSGAALHTVLGCISTVRSQRSPSISHRFSPTHLLSTTFPSDEWAGGVMLGMTSIRPPFGSPRSASTDSSNSRALSPFHPMT